MKSKISLWIKQKKRKGKFDPQIFEFTENILEIIFILIFSGFFFPISINYLQIINKKEIGN